MFTASNKSAFIPGCSFNSSNDCCRYCKTVPFRDFALFYLNLCKLCSWASGENALSLHRRRNRCDKGSTHLEPYPSFISWDETKWKEIHFTPKFTSSSSIHNEAYVHTHKFECVKWHGACESWQSCYDSLSLSTIAVFYDHHLFIYKIILKCSGLWRNERFSSTQLIQWVPLLWFKEVKEGVPSLVDMRELIVQPHMQWDVSIMCTNRQSFQIQLNSLWSWHFVYRSILQHH